MATQTTDLGQAVGGAAKVGMPQLDFSTFSNQIFWLVITLVVIYFILSRIPCRVSVVLWRIALVRSRIIWLERKT